MKLQTIFKNKNLIVGVIGLINSIPIIWDYYHEGVPVHYLLHDKNMPGFSNWWGMLTIPVLTWTVITLLSKRYAKNTNSSIHEDSKVYSGFFIPLIFSVIISVLFEMDLEQIIQYLMIMPLIISLFKPIYLPENFLGFVLGMTFTFGGVLPIIIWTILLILCFLVYNVIRKGTIFIISKLK